MTLRARSADELLRRTFNKARVAEIPRSRRTLTGRDLIMLTIGFWVGELLLIAVLCLK